MKLPCPNFTSVAMLAILTLLLSANPSLARKKITSTKAYEPQSVSVQNRSSLDKYRARYMKGNKGFRRSYRTFKRRIGSVKRIYPRRRIGRRVLYLVNGFYYVRRGCRISPYRSHIREGRRIGLPRFRRRILFCKPIRIRRIDARSPWRQTRRGWLSHIKPSPTYPTPRR